MEDSTAAVGVVAVAMAVVEAMRLVEEKLKKWIPVTKLGRLIKDMR